MRFSFDLTLLALALLAFLFLFAGYRKKAKVSEPNRALENKMAIAARIAQAAAYDAFNVTLELTDEGIHELDRMLEHGWKPVSEPQAELREVSDSFFVLSAFLGEVLAKNHGARWVTEKSAHQLPFVLFTPTDLAASPFDMLRKKLDQPTEFDLFEAYSKLIEESRHVVAPTAESNA